MSNLDDYNLKFLREFFDSIKPFMTEENFEECMSFFRAIESGEAPIEDVHWLIEQLEIEKQKRSYRANLEALGNIVH